MEQSPSVPVDQTSDIISSPETIQAPASQWEQHHNAPIREPGAGGGTSHQDHEEDYASGDSESTPRSEVPSIADNQSLPPMYHAVEEPGYFAPRPLPYHASANKSTGSIPLQPAQSQSVPPPSLLAESVASGAHRITRPSSTSFDHHGRPTVQRDLSSTSTASTATVTAASFDPVSQPASNTRKPPQEYPQFPNQAYAALQSQLHPSPYPPPPPPPFRARSAHPSDYASSSTAVSPFNDPRARLITESGSKTVGNSPAGSPGLFTPTASPVRAHASHFEEDGYYSTPYLHFTHMQAPKETHVADVDVDPVSGRKIINEYEILDELGRGAHGKVKLGRSLTTSTFVAIKIVERYAKKRRLGKLGNTEDKVKKEVAILKKARHPNIVALLEVIDDPARKKVYIVLEWVQRGEITWRTRCPKALALLEARRYLRQSEGIFHDKEAEDEDEAIWDVSERRRLKLGRRQQRNTRRQRLQDYSYDSWSFEYGGEYDEDEWDMASQESSAPSDTAAGRARKASRETSVSDILKTVTQGSMDAENRAGIVPDSSDSTTAEKELAENRVNVGMPTGLEGTMYGAYETESPSRWQPFPGRRPGSVAGFHPGFEGAARTKSSPEELLDAELHDDLIYVPCLSFAAARVAFRDTVLGIEYLHYQGIIHRDIKPPNLLQTVDHHIKISDFGVSYLGRPIHDDGTDDSETDVQDVKFDEARELAKTVGTAAFYAPELCHTDPDVESPPVTAQIDVWALGVTLFCLIFARTPFVDNEFVIMKNIAEKDVYIPTKRLKPIEPEASSRPSSQVGFTPFLNTKRRQEYERAYEDLDEDLYDLLRRLFIKDPSRRITLTEVKHHPWVLRDIADPIAWLDETDPSRQSEGKKIEITKEEMNDAVVPLNIIERMRSGIRKLGGALGIGGGKSGTTSSNRKRTKSNATHAEAGISSATSSSSTLSQEGRRPSLRGDELSSSSFRIPRESEHPLSQSLTASPDLTESGRPPFSSSPDRSASPAGTITKKDSNPLHTDISRTEQEGRTQSPLTQTSSVRTVRPADVAKMIVSRTTSKTPPPPSAGLPGTPRSLETSGSTGLSGLFGGASRRILRPVRSRSPGSGSGSSRDASAERGLDEHDDPHGPPSVALSNDLAAGRLDPPDLLKEMSGSSLSTSPSASRAQSLVNSENSPGAYHSKASSYGGGYPQDRPTSFPSGRRPSQDLNLQLARSGSIPIDPNASTDARFHRAQDELLRRRQHEATQLQQRPASSYQQHRAPTSSSYEGWPPSPDDEIFYRRRRHQEEEALRLQTSQRIPSLEASPTSSASHLPHDTHQIPAMTPSSSEDQLTSAMSQSTSNPSIPSVASANSSIVPDDGTGVGSFSGSGGGLALVGAQKPGPGPPMPRAMAMKVGRGRVGGRHREREDEEGYVGDGGAAESGEEDEEDSDEEGGFLEMSRKRGT